MPAGLARRAGSPQRPAVHGDPPAVACRWADAGLGPPAEPIVERVGVQTLQGPPERGLTRHHLTGPELGQGRCVGVGGPLRDRHVRTGTGQHRAHRQPQHRRQPVPDPTALTRVSDPGQHRQQPRTITGERLSQPNELADRRVDR